jgi:hypothetical protein
MTSKELGMAVAEKLQQAEKRQEIRGAETPKQQTPMRRALQPPVTRELECPRIMSTDLDV